MKSVYKNLVTFNDAVETALREIEPIRESETVDLFNSSGRILAHNVYAPRNNPPFNRSTMDGYAVKFRSIIEASQDNPIRLKISGESFIGEPRKLLTGDSNCFKISTGAIVPSGADAVVKVESTAEKGDIVEIFEAVGQSANIAESGSDIAESELLIAGGKELETHDIAVLSSLGISEVNVLRKLKIEVISTGNELIGFNEVYSEGKINDANGVVVSTELDSFPSIEAKYSGIVKDDYASIRKSIDGALKENDVVILSGGSSAGESDLVYKIIEEYEPGMLFHGVLVKPGLPTVFGKCGRKLLIGLPGFPVSALMIFRSIFLIPLLRTAGSRRVPTTRTGKLGVNLRIEMGRQNLVPVSVSHRDTKRIYPVMGLSGSITRFTSTSGFISVPGSTKYLEANSEVEVISWSNEISGAASEFSGIFMKGITDTYLKETPDWDYNRMLPRDALISLSNGDTDLVTFLASAELNLQKYISEGVRNEGMSIYTGKQLTLVLATAKDSKVGVSDFSAANGDLNASGPSLRFLKNIVDPQGSLRETIKGVEDILTSYIATGLENAASMVAQKKSGRCVTTSEFAKEFGLKMVPICDIMPVFVVKESEVNSIGEFLNLTSLEKL